MTVEVGINRSTCGLSGALTDALALRMGAHYPDPHGRAREFAGMSLLEMGQKWLALQGMDIMGLTRAEMARLLMDRRALAARFRRVVLTQGTTDFDSILADALNKTLRAAYILAPVTWPLWCRKGTAPDYKEVKRVQLGEAPGLAPMQEGAEYTYGSFGDAKEVYALGKYGKAAKLTREAVINDELGAFGRLLAQMGAQGRVLEDATAAGVLTANANMSDGVPLFDEAHANVGTGVLDVEHLGAARAKLRLARGLDGVTILSIAPRALVVPAALETNTEQLIGSIVDPSKSNDTVNPFANKLIPAVMPQLDASSAVQWYLTGDPAVVDTVEVCFLAGEESPVVESADDFNTDAKSFKVRHSVAAKAIDWRALYRSTGV